MQGAINMLSFFMKRLDNIDELQWKTKQQYCPITNIVYGGN